jgi:hypothetical protein
MRFMQYWSEEYDGASWATALEKNLVHSGDPQVVDTLRWLIAEAGGWGTWDDQAGGPVFVEGSFAELAASAGPPPPW